MNAQPVLALQTRRLGDLILSFPLFVDLRRRFPKNPLWVVARPEFFTDLMPLAPEAVFFPPEHLPNLAKLSFAAILNLDSGKEGARTTALAEAPLKLGAMATGPEMRISGFWQLYRAALTQNNRHNTFHWADLFRMDLGCPLPSLTTAYPAKMASGRVALFVGASEPTKRPENTFWAALARRLAQTGLKPILLGGPGERGDGAAIAKSIHLPGANFCGKTTLSQLAAILGGVDLCITPDTGPMHLANWVGAPVLNLSMGNVNAAETGPVNTGQWVLRPSLSCRGCWNCELGKPRCRFAFAPQAVARLATAIIAGDPQPWADLPQALNLSRVSRDTANGLLRLTPCGPGKPTLRDLLDNFWRETFLALSPSFTGDPAAAALAIINGYPAAAEKIHSSLGAMLVELSRALKAGARLPDDFWNHQPRHCRLYAGHIQMTLQNSDFSRDAGLATLDDLERVKEYFSRQI